MTSSTGNYSGASSHPPSLNDTSGSSASAGKTGLRNTSGHRRHKERDQLHFVSPSQYYNNYDHLERDHNMHDKSTRSMDSPEYKFSRDLATMSDPGGTLFERDHNQSRSQVEYARPHSTTSHSSFHESQYQHLMSRQDFQGKRNKETKNEYSSASIRRKSLSPPLEQQGAKAYSRPSNKYSHNFKISNLHRNSFSHMNGVYHDGMYTSSPSHNEQSLDSSSSTSAVNVKELQKQLWNNNQSLTVPVASSNQYVKQTQQSLSQIRHPRRQRPTSPNNLHRYARSLSPSRRQNQNPSSKSKENPLLSQKADSAISDSSFNNRFHSKFYEAALVAQTLATGNKKGAAENDLHRPQNQMQRYRQQEEHYRQSPLPRSKNQGDWSEHPHQNRLGKLYKSSPSEVHNASNRSNNSESYMNVAAYSSRSDSGANTSIGIVGDSTYQNPIIPPSPLSSSSQTPLSNEQGTNQLRQRASMERGRDKGLPRFRSSDGINTRRIRPPSPLLLDRIRSYDHEYYNDSGQGFSGGQEQGNKTVVDRRDRHLRNHDLHRMHHRDIVHNDNSHGIVGESHTNGLYIESNEGLRKKHTGDSTNGRLHDDGNNFNKHQIEASIIDHNVQGGSLRKQLEGSKFNADGIGGDRMANLVDKLSAVNRENPVSALAQIDSILRRESQNAHAKSFESDRYHADTRDSKIPASSNNYTEQSYTGRPNEYDDGVDVASDTYDDDESSDVSSITNPTFQQGIPKSYNSNQINQLYIRENDHYNMHTTAWKSNLGEKHIGDFNKLAYNPSTSSFRRPRPSHLQNYSKDFSKDQNKTSHSEWKGEQMQKFPPPSTIQVKDDSVKNEYHRQSPTHFREKMLQKNVKTRAVKNDKAPVKQRTSTTVHDKPERNLDKLVDDKKVLAEKIRGWDELSNELSISRSEREENVTGHESLGAYPKRYPWDTELNLVQTKDTSMDNAIGIETEMTTNPHESSMYRRKFKKEVETSMESSQGSNERKGNHFAKARRNIKDRSDPDVDEEEATDSNKNKKDRKGRYTNASASDHGDDNRIPIVVTSMSGIPQFNPSEQKPLVHREKDLNETKSNIDGRSSSVMPPSTLFPSIDDNFEPHINPKLLEASNRSKSMDMTGKVSGINEVATGLNNLNIQNRDGFSESRSIARLACKTNLNKELRSKEKKRGFLRAFMEKKKKKPTDDGHAASATLGSVSGQSNSIESRGVKSAPQIHSTSRPKSSEAISNLNIRFLPPPPGVLNPIDASTDKRNRSRADHRNTSTSRSRSSEKFRSSSMAKKFNRVMELYNSDEI